VGCEPRQLNELPMTGDNPVPAQRWYQDSMNRPSALFLVLVGTMTLGAAGLRAAGNEGGLADLQQSIQQSTAKLQGQAAQIQAEQSQQRAESASRGGIGVQVVNPGPQAPLAPTTPMHCVTRYTGANVFTDCR
jgi:hypothetical protein